VQTRLTDLEGSLTEKNRSVACNLLEEAIEEFNNFGQISRRVTEISVFNSPFFVGCFLPLLLTVSSADDEPRQGLIRELYRYHL